MPPILCPPIGLPATLPPPSLKLLLSFHHISTPPPPMPAELGQHIPTCPCLHGRGMYSSTGPAYSHGGTNMLYSRFVTLLAKVQLELCPRVTYLSFFSKNCRKLWWRVIVQKGQLSQCHLYWIPSKIKIRIQFPPEFFFRGDGHVK